MGEQDGGPFDLGLSLVGLVLHERYVVESVLGAGGMGAVYLAKDTKLSRQVVVKVPHVELLASPKFRTRFEREITSLIGLDHPHVVKVLDVGTEGTVPYAVLQYLGGGNLEDRLAAAARPLVAAEVAAWLPDVALALDFIHRRGFVHRDVKPGNIMFDESGYAYVGDFGIARLAGDVEGGLTQTGFLVGSPRYMPPEAGHGGTPAPTYDQYSLGVVVYRSLAGKIPHDADTPLAIMTQKAMAPAPDLARVCPSLHRESAAAVMRTLESDPARRFPNCEEFAAAFVEPLALSSSGRLRRGPQLAPARGGLVEPTEAAGDPTVVERSDARPIAPSLARRVERALLGVLAVALLGVLAWQFRAELRGLFGEPAPPPAADVARDEEAPAALDAAEAEVASSSAGAPTEPAVETESPAIGGSDDAAAESAATDVPPIEGAEAPAQEDTTPGDPPASEASPSPTPAPELSGGEAAPEPAAPEPTPEERRAALLAEAKTLARRRAYTTGERNAVSLYRQVLAEDPGNEEAAKELRSIHDRFARMAVEREKKGDAAGARAQYEKALAVLDVPATREALTRLDTPPPPSKEPPPHEVAAETPAAEAAPAAAELLPLGRNERGHEVLLRSRDGARVVRVRGGTFRMGSEAGRPDERPVHQVKLSPFLIDEREVTWEQYQRFMRARGLRLARVPSFGASGDHPVVNLDWSQAVAYCEWAGARLPTEAEWELAARGLDAFTHPWGNDWDATRVNGKGPDAFANTAPVGSFPAGQSPYGLLDMVGNVSEWVADWYDPAAYAASEKHDPKGPATGTRRVTRGGNFNTADPIELTGSARGSKDPEQYFANYGCRCAMDAR